MGVRLPVCVCANYLVVIEVSVDGEPVCAKALQVSGTLCLRPPLNSHEGSVTPGPEQLRNLLFLLTAARVTTSWKHKHTFSYDVAIYGI